MNKGFFYWVLMRHHLPAMWHYFGACVYSKKERQKTNAADDTLELGGSILSRAVRALQARDAIGLLFYSPQNNDTRDTILYHFDYLTLLLVGVFDAQARIAYRAYNFTKPKKEEFVSFRRSEFLSELKNHTGSQKLYNILSRQDFNDFSTLLNELRHTIHGAGLNATAVISPSERESEASFLKVPTRYVNDLWNASNQLGAPESWGLVKDFGSLLLEPYTYCSALIKKAFELINEIADATDVIGLFPYGSSIPTWDNKAPQDKKAYGEPMGKRLSILAW